MIKALLYFLITFFGYMLLRNLFSNIQRIGQDGNNHERSKVSNGIDLKTAYSILGASPGDSDQEIRSKYREMTKKYHPDVIQSKDLAEGFIEYANERTSAIKRAYEIVMAERKRRSK